MMSLWFKPPDLEQLNARGLGDLANTLGMRLTEVGDEFLRGTMPVDQRTRQPFGLLHGGASVALAETLGSVAANLCLDLREYFAVGTEISASHLRSVSSGLVTGTARPLRVGRTAQVWDIRIEDEQGQLCCISRLSVAVIRQRP